MNFKLSIKSRMLASLLSLASLLGACQEDQTQFSKVQNSTGSTACFFLDSVKPQQWCKLNNNTASGTLQPVSVIIKSALGSVSKEVPQLGIHSKTPGVVMRRLIFTKSAGVLKNVTQYSVRFYPREGQEAEVIFHLDGQVIVNADRPLIVRPFPAGIWGSGSKADPLRAKLGVVSFGLAGSLSDVQNFAKKLLSKLNLSFSGGSLSLVSEVTPGIFAFNLNVTPYEETKAINVANEIMPNLLQAWPERIVFSMRPEHDSRDEVISIFNGDIQTIAELEKRARE